ncbi:D-alanyl-D-alanine carboxypeptidase family protein [Novosphingobium sp. ZN18A2]|uniref:D-alanyl-D-alanine carboxypeptidase family protein n=1 Tax=Novosphingobium sp. ZN18A2 TaxID=3079861 RepID=UPI0030CCE2D6
MTRLAAALLIAVSAALPVRAAAPEALTSTPDEEFRPTAPIALMVDMSSGETLFSRQPDRRFVPASLTKIMTAYVAFELIDEGKLDPQQRFTMSNAAFRKWHRVGSTMFLDRGSSTTVEDLLMGIVTVSANDGCIVLADGIAGSVPKFTAMMNAKARELGMTNSHYHTPNGWMDQGQTYVTAGDLVKLARAMITRHPRLYRHYFGHETMTFNGIEQRNHNPIYGHVAGADGVKTGFTNQAGYGFVGSAERNGRRLLMVLAGMDSGSRRRTEAREFMEWGFHAWKTRPLVAQGGEVGRAIVQGGDKRTVPLVAPQAYTTTVRRGQTSNPVISIRYDGPLRAPVKQGATVATMVVKQAGQPEIDLPLVAGKSVAAGDTFDRIRDGLATLVGA